MTKAQLESLNAVNQRLIRNLYMHASISSQSNVEENTEIYRDLLYRIKQGDSGAEADLVQRFYRGVFLLLMKRCQKEQLSQDLTQETFIVLINQARAGNIRSPEALPAYVRQIAVNLMIAHFRKEHRKSTDCDEDIDIHPDLLTDSLVKHLHHTKMTSLVQQLINEMQVKRDRDILLSYFVDGHSKELICSQLDLDHTHFDRVIYRAKQRLKQLIEHKLNPVQGSSTVSKVVWTVLLVSLFFSSDKKISIGVGENQFASHFKDQIAKNHVRVTEYRLSALFNNRGSIDD